MKKLFVTFAALVMFYALALAQTATADLYGKVVDTGGSAVSGVEVYLTGDVVGQKSVLSSAAGNFRFMKLAPGKYQLELKKGGFQTVIYKGIRMLVGKNKYLRIEMPAGSANPPLEITDDKPIDTRRTTTAANITEEELQSLPTARNPWTILRLVPGMMLDREDIGGNESGQQSSFYGLGASRDDTTWYLDAANISDPSAIGAAPAYLNTNQYEEIQVTMAANDISAQTGGTQLNFVKRRGGNRFSGDFHLYVEDEKWEMSQTLPQSIIDLGYGSPGIYRLYQYGVNFGGAIIRDKLWFFGSYGVQDIHARTITKTEDATWLLGYYGKVDFQFGNTSGMVQYSNDKKLKWGRTDWGPASHSIETTWDQKGPMSTYLGSIQQVMGNLMLNAKFAYTDGGFELNPKANADYAMQKQNQGVVVPDWYYYRTPARWMTGNYEYYLSNRNTLNLSIDGNYFAEGVMGGDHEIRFGADYYTATTTTQDILPNHRCLFIYDRYNPYGYKEIWWVRDYIFDVGFNRISAYLSDTATFGKLTVNLGLRYDKETGSHNATKIPGLLFNGVTPIFTGYLGDLNIPAKDVDAAYEVISPRISFTYDITGDGKNVVKGTFARYGSQSGNAIADHTYVGAWSEIDVYWADDGDLIPELGEFSQIYDPGIWIYWSIDPLDPYSTTSPNAYDPDFNSPILTELTFAYERAFAADIVLALNLFYKKTTNLLWYRGYFVDKLINRYELETAANWYLAGTYTFADPSKTKPYYQRYEVPNASFLTNHSGSYDLYQAIQLVFSKKLSYGWMLDASFTYANWKSHDDYAESFDKTNFDFFQDGAVAPESGGPGTRGTYVNSRWQFKLSGLYQLPWGINITGVFQAREGYVVPYYELMYRGSGLGWTNMYEPDKKFGDDRLPDFWVLNLGLEKTFDISGVAVLTLFVNGYNITNNNTTLRVNPLLGTATTSAVERILNPGIFQFGIRVNF